MNTGTPLDLTPFGAVLQVIGPAYWLLALAAMAAALWFPKRWWVKVVAALVVAAAFAYVPGKRDLELRAKQREFQTRYEAARVHFELRCKEAGERIERREHGIDGVYLMKIRPITVNYGEQFTADDVYGHDAGGADYIRTFLRVTKGLEIKNQFGESLAPRYGIGYAWIEANDPKDGRLYRYTLVHKVVQKLTAEQQAQAWKNYPSIGEDVYGVVLEREPIDKPSARYGVTWEDISSREGREQWVAGGALRVVDLQTNTTIAERKGYMWDVALGNQAGGRAPWLYAQQSACPAFPPRGKGDLRRERTRREALDFVTSILEPAR